MSFINSQTQYSDADPFVYWVFNFYHMKEIQLSKQGKHKGKYVALIDDEDFEMVNAFKWQVHINNNRIYAFRAFRINNIMQSIFMHNLIKGSKMIDHIDHNGLNNQKYNLRICNHTENMWNRRPSKNCKSIYKGVTVNNKLNKFIATIYFNKKRIYLGIFEKEIDAAKAYDAKAKELFGEFAYLNFK